MGIVQTQFAGRVTLLEAIAIALEFNPEGGSRNFNFGTRESRSELHDYVRIAKDYRRHRDGFFIATHSPILMSCPDALILHCGPTGLQTIRYEDTEHFRITSDFLLRRDRMLDILMDR